MIKKFYNSSIEKIKKIDYAKVIIAIVLTLAAGITYQVANWLPKNRDFWIGISGSILTMILTVFFVDYLIKRSDDLKWNTAHRKIGEFSASYMNSLEYHFSEVATSIKETSNTFPEAFADKKEMHSKKGIDIQRQLLFKELNEELQRRSSELDKETLSYFQKMQLLVPSLNAELAFEVINFYQSSVTLRTMATALLSTWILFGINNLEERIVVNESFTKHNTKVQLEAEHSLKRICELAKIPTMEVRNRVFIFQDIKIKNKDINDKDNYIYPRHALIRLSLNKIANILKMKLN